MSSVTAIVVTYRQVELTLAAVASLERQTVPPHEIIVVDNDPGHSAREPLLAAHPDLRLLHEDNIGYAPACNRAAALATGDWLFFLNPDAEAEPDCLERLLEVAAGRPAAGVVAPQMLFPDRRVNAGENQIHLTGIVWCGRFEEPVEDGPPRTAFITTGAAMLVRRALYEQLDGYCEEFFLFYEDPDFCWRTWLVGSEVWYAPRAKAIHHYSWGDGTEKWFYLERHRLLAMLTNHRLSTLLVLAPLLLATEAALVAVASREGWRTEKLRAYRAVLQRRRWIRDRRRALRAMRRLPDAAIIDRFRATVDTPQLDSSIPGRVAPLLRLYHAVAVALVKAIGR